MEKLVEPEKNDKNVPPEPAGLPAHFDFRMSYFNRFNNGKAM